MSISADGTISTNGAISGRLKLVEFAPTVEYKECRRHLLQCARRRRSPSPEIPGAPGNARELKRQPGHQRSRVNHGAA